MSTLTFDGLKHTLTLHTRKNEVAGTWHANNVVDHRAGIRFLPNRFYRVLDSTHPHKHGKGDDTTDGKYGQYGIVRLHPFCIGNACHAGVGVHSGRKNKGGADHATMGCIRTTDEAMKAISDLMHADSVESLTVQHNHVQHTPHRKHPGDHHQSGGTIVLPAPMLK